MLPLFDLYIKLPPVVVSSMYTVGSTLLRPSFFDGGGKVLQGVDGGIPVDARISDGDTLLKCAWTLRRDLLVALVDVGLDHDGDNTCLTLADLLRDNLGYFGLVAVVLAGITWAS
jgi:hypothetical protein